MKKINFFSKNLNRRWRHLAWLHQKFWAKKIFFSKYIYKNPRKNLQNPWTSAPSFWNRNCRNRHKPDHLPPEYVLFIVLLFAGLLVVVQLFLQALWASICICLTRLVVGSSLGQCGLPVHILLFSVKLCFGSILLLLRLGMGWLIADC